MATLNSSHSQMCTCGRRSDQLHCPMCGWADIRALVSKQHYEIMPDGTERVVMTYRCRKCAAYFDDKDRELNCRALPPRRGRRPDELRDKRPDEVITQERIDELDQQSQEAPLEDISHMTSTQRIEYLRKRFGNITLPTVVKK